MWQQAYNLYNYFAGSDNKTEQQEIVKESPPTAPGTNSLSSQQFIFISQ